MKYLLSLVLSLVLCSSVFAQSQEQQDNRTLCLMNRALAIYLDGEISVSVMDGQTWHDCLEYEQEIITDPTDLDIFNSLLTSANNYIMSADTGRAWCMDTYVNHSECVSRLDSANTYWGMYEWGTAEYYYNQCRTIFYEPAVDYFDGLIDDEVYTFNLKLGAAETILNNYR